MNKEKQRKKSIFLTGIVTVLIFAVLLYEIQNPLKFRQFTTGLRSDFDQTQDFIKFIDVGQGDCALIYSNGYAALIDTGLSSTADDLLFNFADCNISSLDAVIISHLHADHIGGLSQIIKTSKIENLIMPQILSDSIDIAKNDKLNAVKNGTDFYDARQGMNFCIGEFEITVLSDFENQNNENNRSLFVMAQIDDIRFLFTGDAETDAEELLLKENLDIDCEVLKVSHHGSDSSTSESFLNATTPEYAVISVGEDNKYSHPHSSVINTLEHSGAEIYRTDSDGDITFYIEDGKININTEMS